MYNIHNKSMHCLSFINYCQSRVFNSAPVGWLCDILYLEQAFCYQVYLVVCAFYWQTVHWGVFSCSWKSCLHLQVADFSFSFQAEKIRLDQYCDRTLFLFNSQTLRAIMKLSLNQQRLFYLYKLNTYFSLFLHCFNGNCTCKASLLLNCVVFTELCFFFKHSLFLLLLIS